MGKSRARLTRDGEGMEDWETGEWGGGGGKGDITTVS